jgi:predicted unusual protein kinase regulating ubiquinone biosynthesis (AarF/ABC1/UbiB family)
VDGLPIGRFRRLAKPARLGASSAAATAGTWARNRLRDPEARDAAQTARMIRTAEQAVAVMGEMKGAVMKLGQMLSFADTSMLPDEFQAILAQLQQDAPPMAWELIERVITDELGEHPDVAFARFSRVPIAAASIGQVHSARLHDGTDVVVKVQYPGVAEAIDNDLRNTTLLTTILNLGKSFAGPFAPKTDVKAVARELRDRMLEELDYRAEARNQTRFAEIWRDVEDVRIPTIVPELSTARVLTQHYDDGMRWSAAVEAGQDLRDRWGEVIARFVFTSLYRNKIFNADPHPGNYLFHEDGSVTFLDFGCVKEFTQRDVDGLRAIRHAIVAQDADRLVKALVEFGWYDKPPKAKPEDLLTVLEPGFAPLRQPQPFTITPEWAAEAVRMQLGISPGHQRTIGELAVPPQYTFLARISLGLFSVLAGLRASLDWTALVTEVDR